MRRRDWLLFWTVLSIVPLTALFAPKGAATGEPVAVLDVVWLVMAFVWQLALGAVFVLFLLGAFWVFDGFFDGWLDRRDDRARERGEVRR